MRQTRFPYCGKNFEREFLRENVFGLGSCGKWEKKYLGQFLETFLQFLKKISSDHFLLFSFSTPIADTRAVNPDGFLRSLSRVPCTRKTQHGSCGCTSRRNTFGTSHVALVHRARLTSGQVLMVLGAAGGVGLAAVQIGKSHCYCSCKGVLCIGFLKRARQQKEISREQAVKDLEEIDRRREELEQLLVEHTSRDDEV
ncbi:uncharacterized protein LOC18013756 [Eutrema salsugineum]|uniref:uncharacterized protein LOC18013756 n=1 Tax=Eutrema salsugineum TaxID=72664 RepID=UPI000CED13CA|nr:uncharacterized protein LOC18013756 [Eutrema salsugineum]